MADQTNLTWVNSVSYGPADELLQMQANGFIESRTYNANLQLIELVSGTNVHLKYNYSATQNNGQIGSQQDVVSGETISYQYDSLKRLVQASATGDPSGAWSQAMSYDGFGNLTQKVSSNAPALSVAVDWATNRMQTNAAYDANGNLTGYASDGYGYDLRNRMVQANPASGGTVLYGYDTTNHRIYKGAYNGGTYSAEEIYFYGVEGHKYGTWRINPSSGVLVQASVTKQWFGSRLVSPEDRLGSQGKYFAWGEERTNISPVNPSNDQEKFATYTRDSATGLDYANQRYYSSLIGRFTRPDPYSGSARATDPQSWNRYSYGLNDPTNNIDPTGLEACAVDFCTTVTDYVDWGWLAGGGGGYERPQPEIYLPPDAFGGGSVPLDLLDPNSPFSQAANKLLQARQALAERTVFSIDCYDDILRIQAQRSSDSRASDASLSSAITLASGAELRNGVGSSDPISSLYANPIAGAAAQRSRDAAFGPGQTIGNDFARNTNGLTAESVSGGTAIYINGSLIPNDLKQNEAFLLHETYHLLGFDDTDLQRGLGITVDPANTQNITDKLKRDCIN